MKLTNRILDAISQMSSVVAAGAIEDYTGYDDAPSRKEYEAAIDAGIWARQQLAKRKSKKKPVDNGKSSD